MTKKTVDVGELVTVDVVTSVKSKGHPTVRLTLAAGPDGNADGMAGVACSPEEAEELAAALLVGAARARASDLGRVKWSDAQAFARLMRGVAAEGATRADGATRNGGKGGL